VFRGDLFQERARIEGKKCEGVGAEMEGVSWQPGGANRTEEKRYVILNEGGTGYVQSPERQAPKKSPSHPQKKKKKIRMFSAEMDSASGRGK